VSAPGVERDVTVDGTAISLVAADDFADFLRYLYLGS
jgi:hypothetical protein